MRFFTALMLAVALLLTAGTVHAQNVNFTASSPIINIGATGDVFVTVDGADGTTGKAGMTTMQFAVEWDPAVFDFVSVGNFGLPNLSAANFGTGTPGRVTVSWDSPSLPNGSPVIDGTTIFSIELQPAANVCVGGSSPVVFGSPPPIQVTVEPFPTLATVTTVDGTASVAGTNLAPILTSIAPTSGVLGETLNVIYTGFDIFNCTTVNFSDPEVTGTVLSISKQALATSLTAEVVISDNADVIVPGATSLSNPAPGGGMSASQPFTIEYPAPVITAVNPPSAQPGETLDVTLTGINFVSDFPNESMVTTSFGGDITVNTTTVQSCSGKLCTEIVVNITVAGGAAPGAGTMTVMNPAPGGGTDNATFTIGNPPPDIVSVTPNTGARGDTNLLLTVAGSGFVDNTTGATAVTFANADVTVNSVTVNTANDMTVDVTIDPGATLGADDVTVTNPLPAPLGDTDTLVDGFTVENPPPTLASLNPAVGDIGQTLNVTLTGSEFVDDGGNSATVDFGPNITVNSTVLSKNAALACTGSPGLCTQIVANITIGAGATPGLRAVSVTNPAPGGGTSALPASFTVNTPPDAVNDNAETDVGVLINIDVLFNDTDADGDPLDITAIPSPPSNGNAVITGAAPNETINYTPNPGFGGADSFTYRISDGVGTTTDVATVNVFVDAPPNAVDDQTTTFIGVPVDINALVNDDPVDGDPLTIIAVASPTAQGGVAVIINAGQQIRYTPPSGFIGEDTFGYTIDDGRGNTDTANIRVRVFGNRPPIARDDRAQTNENTSVLVDVLDNDVDPDGDPITLTRLVSPPSDGTAVIEGDKVRYTPAPGFSGQDGFDYEIQDDEGAATKARALITVNPRGNAAPVANDDAATTTQGVAVDVDVLANDTDPDGDPITLDAVSNPPTNGTAVINAGKITYTPNAGFSGVDTFEYIVKDDRGGEDAGEVTVAVDANAPPMAQDDAVTTERNTAVSVPVLANDSDPDGDPITLDAIVAVPSNGSAVLDGTSILYTPDAGFLGSDTFSYEISDDKGATDQADVTVTVTQASVFNAQLSGANSVPANASNGSSAAAAKSLGTGSVTASLNGNTLTVEGSFSGLMSDFNTSIGAHIHRGFAGQNGPVVFPLNVTVGSDGRSGTLSAAANTFTLSQSQVDDLLDRRLYVNVHTVDLPAGELRGQLVASAADASYRVVLSGRAEVPANGSAGLGGAVVEVRGTDVIVSGSFSGIGSPYRFSHFHQADIGSNGGVVVTLNATVAADGLSGTYEPANNTFTADQALLDALADGLIYVNVHSNNLPGGELRGQVLPESHRVFEFSLAGMNEVQPVQSGGTGGGIAVFDGTDLRVAGNFAGLGSDFNASVGAHLHGAGAGENGGVIFPLTPTLDADNRGGSFAPGANTFTLDAAQEDRLFDAGFYVNVHTVDVPSGELRGQVVASTNVAPAATSITSPGDGAMVDITGEPSTPFVATWGAAGDANGNPVVYRWQLSTAADFSSLLFEAAGLLTPQFETDFGTVATLLTNAGIGLGESVTVFHRAVSTDGSLSTAGPGSSVTLMRGTIVAVEDGGEVPNGFAVHGNYPNPFNPSTSIRVDLPRAAEVTVEIYDLLGRLQMTVPVQQLPAGDGQTLQVDASGLTSGTYIYRVMARSQADLLIGSGRMVLLK